MRNLTFDGFDGPQLQDDPEDGIEVDGGSPVWIEHNRFSNAQDKAIQVTASRAITVSANHFANQSQIVQFGCFECPDSVNIRATLYDNYFEGRGIGYRMPTVNYGYFHAFNNVLTDWRNFGMASNRKAQLLSQANVFDAGVYTKAIIYNNSAPVDKDPSFGYVRAEGDLKLDGATVNLNQPELVGAPRYLYTADVATLALRDRVVTTAGPAA